MTREVEAERYICSPLEFAFDVQGNAGAPVMELGFGDVEYPAGYDKRVVRVGLEQLNKMKDDGYKLHIPVSKYQNKGNVLNGKKLYFGGGSLTFSHTELTVSGTNDPTVTVGAKVADIEQDGANGAYVSTSRMYIPLDFSVCEVDFHEGYYYEVSTSYMDEEDDPNDPCASDLYIVFKVVPEFVTWDAKQIGTSSLYSGNWYDDKNWLRSTRAELYKDENVTGKTQNTATAGHPDGYQDNGEISTELDPEGKRPGFVPMKFTYVTLLGDNHSPSMINEDYGGKIPGTPQNGGSMISPTNDLASDTSPSVGSSAYLDDKFIRYDMLVRYGTHADGGEGCFGHQTMSNGGSGWGWNTFDESSFTTIDKVYDCEKFYGNICKEIYFKPGAELRLQQRLKYEKAWVEEELEPNRWYLMSTPLKGTYAGDMYVPTSMTDVTDGLTVAGRQVTEAFQPINFSTTAKAATSTKTSQPAYSRTKYPIYQRSWNLDDAKVYTKTDDVRATDYSAYLKFSTVSSNLLEWSHTYNDVQVPYNKYSGFAIRANRKATDKALIRLPKADTSYDYYQWDNTKPASGAVAAQTVDKTDAGRFVFDNTSVDQEQWTIPLSKLQAQGTDEEGYTYYLVGNPFMASIDMGKFFGYQDGSTYYSYNEKLSPVYYIYKDGAATPVDATAEITAANKSERIIRPLQAFIVKCKAADAPGNIVFNRWAITDGNYTDPTRYVPQGSQSGGNNPSGGTRALTLKAANGQGSSTASVNLSEAASDGYAAEEDATTLFDSNLSDVPVVYTVAGNKAVSIDTRSAIDIVPFGVACASSDETVEVNVDCSKFTVNGLQFTDDNHLYMIDVVTGSVTEVGDGSSFAVQPNDYGRYFLTTRSDMTAIRETLASEDIVVSVRNRQLTVRSASELESVRVLNTNGMVVASQNDCGKETSVNLTLGGVYIIEAETEHGRKTRKVIVK